MCVTGGGNAQQAYLHWRFFFLCFFFSFFLPFPFSQNTHTHTYLVTIDQGRYREDPTLHGRRLLEKSRRHDEDLDLDMDMDMDMRWNLGVLYCTKGGRQTRELWRRRRRSLGGRELID